jgi:hypothetical protein
LSLEPPPACVAGPDYILSKRLRDPLVTGQTAIYDLTLAPRMTESCTELDTSLHLALAPLRSDDFAALVVTIGNAAAYPPHGPLTVVLTLSPGLTYVSRDGAPAWDCATRDALLLCTRLDPADIAARDRAARPISGPDGKPGQASAPITDRDERLTLVLHVAADAPADALVRGRLLTPSDARPGNDHAQRDAAIAGGQGDVSEPDLPEPWRTLFDPAVTPPVVLDWLPDGLVYQAATGVGWVCDALGHTVLCTVPPSAEGRWEPAVALAVDVAADARDRLLNLSGLSAARTASAQVIPIAGECSIVEGSVNSEPVVPPLCLPTGKPP